LPLDRSEVHKLRLDLKDQERSGDRMERDEVDPPAGPPVDRLGLPFYGPARAFEPPANMGQASSMGRVSLSTSGNEEGWLQFERDPAAHRFDDAPDLADRDLRRQRVFHPGDRRLGRRGLRCELRLRPVKRLAHPQDLSRDGQQQGPGGKVARLRIGGEAS
jgi:hypothetical protein